MLQTVCSWQGDSDCNKESGAMDLGSLIEGHCKFRDGKKVSTAYFSLISAFIWIKIELKEAKEEEPNPNPL